MTCLLSATTVSSLCSTWRNDPGRCAKTVCVSDDRLLGHLARRFARSEEDIASESLVWLLNRSAAARSALVQLAFPIHSSAPDDLSFVGQESSPDAGRPDVTAKDANGIVRLLIEAKFAAALTPQQPAGYLQRLPADADSVLLVVAPSARRETLWAELLSALPQLASNAPSPSDVPSEGILRAQVGDHSTLTLATWRSVVTCVLDAVHAADQIALAHDAEQLLALTEVMDNQAFLPLKPGDLGWRTARQVGQLRLLIDAAYSRLVSGEHSAVKQYSKKPSYGGLFYGWYLISKKSHMRFWYGFTAGAWSKNGASPVWANIAFAPPTRTRNRLLQAFHSFHTTGKPGLHETDKGIMIPLLLPHFSSEETAIRSIEEQVNEIVAMLDAAVRAGEELPPEVPSPSDLDEDPLPDIA